MRVRGVLAEERALAVLLPEARRLARLNERFARAAPAGLARACRVAALEGDTALVYCGHGAAAARLRSQTATLARALDTAETPVAALKVKVRADWAAPARQAKRDMPPAALAAWASLRDELADAALKAAVDRLLRHQGGR
jgi:hypothetical protein